MYFLTVFLLAFFCRESFSACADKFALSSVDALVYKQKNSKAIVFKEENFYLLDEYILIDVTRANVSELCEGMIKNFARLETLSLININLTLIEPGTFQNVPKLKHLSLSVNQLATIPRGVFNTIPSLKVIYLTRNEIKTIDDGAFSEMPELKAVHLDHNNIKQLTGNIFFGSPKISFVDFSYNLLKNIPKNAFDDLKPGNNIRVLNIHLKNNYIEEIDPEALKPLTPVNLFLESNEITRISEAVFSVKEGSTLNFDNNKIECVADDVIELVKVKNIVVKLKRNPIDCNKCYYRIENMLVDEMRGKLDLGSMSRCQLNYPF